METGLKGAFVISWSQTETDGFKGAAPEALAVGATWAWSGEIVRVDGPAGVLRLDAADGADTLRKSAARMVRRLIGAALDGGARPLEATVKHDSPTPDSSFVVTDGARSYTVTLIPTGTNRAPLALFVDDVPPAGKPYWVVHHALDVTARSAMSATDGGVICFTPGTRIRTPDGHRLVEDLHEGDKVQTKDNGAQEILWRGSRRMSGARLFAMPRLRPVRIQAAAFGTDLPDSTFLVSPEHKMVMRGDVARDLFNTDEVLVSAKHLINDDTVATDLTVREVTYIHLLLPRHEILWANGVETESFHPASTALSTLSDQDRSRLLSGIPSLETDPHIYGAYARRTLSDSEAALLTHAA